MIGIGYEFGSNDNEVFQLRPELVRGPEAFDRREAIWDSLEADATAGHLDSLYVHRIFGEPTSGGLMDWSTRANIEACDDPEVTDYAKHMMRRLMRFATNHPAVRVDFYLGAINHPTMRALFHAGDGRTWNERVQHELALPISIIRGGGNLRMIFDGASGLPAMEDNGFVGVEVQTLLALNRQHPGRVVTETVPFSDHPFAGLPGFMLERDYRRILAQWPERIKHCPDITRVYSHIADNDPVSFARDCAKLGHKAIITPGKLRESNMTIQELNRAVRDAGRPQGVE